MKRKKILKIFTSLTVCGAAFVFYPEESFAIFLGEYNGENLGEKLIAEGKKAYIDGEFANALATVNTQLNSNKQGSSVTFTFEVPTWTTATSGRGGWIERVAGNDGGVIGGGLGVPGYDTMYYGNSPEHQGVFEFSNLSVTTTNKNAEVSVSEPVIDEQNHKATISTTITLVEDTNDTMVPLNYTAENIFVGTTVADKVQEETYQTPPLLVRDRIGLADTRARAVLELGTVNVAVKADTTTSSSTTPSTSTSSSSSTTPSTSTSSSSSTTPSTSTSSSSSTTPSTSTSSSSSTTPSTSTSSSSTTTETSSVMNTEQSTSPSTSTTSSQAKTPVIYTPSEPSTPSITSTSSTSEKFRSTASASTLPKTGEKQSIWITLMGIVLLGASMFYFKKNKVKNK